MKLTGFNLQSKDHENGQLVFQHAFSGNCFTIAATPEEMRHYRIGEYYDLHFALNNLHHEKASGAQAA
jgi:hypothetical protein